MAGSAARMSRNAAVTLTSKVRRHSSSVIFSKRVVRAMAALLTRTSRRPKRSRVRSTIARRSVEFSRSPGTGKPRSPTCRAAVPARSAPRTWTATAAPRSARRFAVASPKPRDAPVTRATRPVKSSGMPHSIGAGRLSPRPLVGSDEAVSIDVEAAEGGDRAHPLPAAQAVLVIAVEDLEADPVLGSGPGAPEALERPDLRGVVLGRLVVEFQQRDPVRRRLVAQDARLQELARAQTAVVVPVNDAKGGLVERPLVERDVAVAVAVQLLEALDVGVLGLGRALGILGRRGRCEGQGRDQHEGEIEGWA